MGVEAIKCGTEKFYDFDSLLDKFYKRPAPGTVNRTHIFSMYKNKPGVIELQDSAESKISTQNLKKGNWSDHERLRMMKLALERIRPMKPPGLRPIKILELAKKWRPLVPEEYRDDFCPIPDKNVIKSVNDTNEKNNTDEDEVTKNNSNGPQNRLDVTDVPQGHQSVSNNANALSSTSQLSTNYVVTDAPQEGQHQSVSNNTNALSSASQLSSNHVPQQSETQQRRRPRRCGICKNVGHNARTCPQVSRNGP